MNPPRHYYLLSVLIALIVGSVIRWMVAQNDGLWLDELHTAWATGGELRHVGPRAIAGNQSGLFFWLVWAARSLVGDSVLVLRSVSLASGLLTMLLAAGLTWNWTRSVIATFVVSWLIAIDPQFVFYSTEARPYALVEMIGVIQVFLFWHWLSRFHSERLPDGNHDGSDGFKTRWLDVGALLSVTTAVMVYVHVTSVWLPLTEVLFVGGYAGMVRWRPQWGFRWRPALVSAILIAIATLVVCIPAWLEIESVFSRRGDWAPVSSIPALLNEFRWPLLLSIVLPTILTTLFYSPHQDTMEDKLFGVKTTRLATMQIPFVLLWAVVPVVSVILLDRFQIAPLALVRYTLIGAVAIPIFCGLCVSLPGKWIGQFAVGAILVGVSLYQNPFAAFVVQGAPWPQLRNENWSDPIAEINSRRDKETQPVFLFANVIEDVHAFETDDPAFQEYLQFPIRGLVPIDRSHRITTAAPTLATQHFRPTDINRMKEQGGGWLLVRGGRPTVDRINQELISLATRMAQVEEEIRREKAEVASDDTKDDTKDNGDSVGSTDGQPAENPIATSIANTPSNSRPLIRIAQFPFSTVTLVSIDWTPPQPSPPVQPGRSK